MAAVAMTRGEELIEAVRALGPQIRAVRDQIDAERQLPSALVNAVAEAGLFRIWIPKSLGGDEVDALTFFRVVEEAARVDGSVGWCLLIGAGTAIFSGYLPASGAEQIYGAAAAITGGFIAPRGSAVPVEGGYRVTGRWPFGSGSTHCTWLLGGCLVLDGESPRLLTDGSPDWRLMYFPLGDFQIIDTWSVGGLRGTGSHDYAVEDVFVPAERTVALDGPAVQPGTLYAFPLLGLFASCLSSVAMGIARGAIDAFAELAGNKTPRGSGPLLRDRVQAQDTIARAEGLLRSGRAFVFETVASVWDEVAAGRPVSLGQRALLRLAATQATRNAMQAVDLVYDAGGASSLFTSSPLERAFRDVHGVTQHAMVQSAMYEPVGRALLGLDPGPRF